MILMLLRVQVISLPSQTCTYKVKITETSVVVKADIISFRGMSYLLTYLLCKPRIFHQTHLLFVTFTYLFNSIVIYLCRFWENRYRFKSSPVMCCSSIFQSFYKSECSSITVYIHARKPR